MLTETESEELTEVESESETEEESETETEEADVLDEEFRLTAQAESGIEVTVSGPVTSLPYPVEEISLTAEEVTDEEVLAIWKQTLEEAGANAEEAFLLDITLWHDEEEIEPLGPVQVTFTGVEMEEEMEDDNFAVFHIDVENENAEDMNAVLDEEGAVVLDTDHFSTYGGLVKTSGVTKKPQIGEYIYWDLSAVGGWNDQGYQLGFLYNKSSGGSARIEVTEKVAERLGITASDITMNDAKVYFTMDALKSKVVPVVLQSNIATARQYDIYGIPMLDPSSVTIFGPQEVIDSIKLVRTELLSRDNVNQSFNATLPLDLLDGQIHSNTKEVKVEVQVEKYTEMDVEVPIKVADSLKVRFFPEMMSVKCLVAMRDYASITPENFTVAVDRQQLKAMQPLLDVRLASWPPTVQILSTRPDKVEYLIVQ